VLSCKSLDLFVTPCEEKKKRRRRRRRRRRQ